MSKHGITLRVNEENLAKLVRDLTDLTDVVFLMDRGVQLGVRYVEQSDPAEYVVKLDKHQRRAIESRLTLEAFAERYGAARGRVSQA